MPAQRNATLCTAQVPCLRSWDSTYASSEECHPMHCSGAMSKILGFYLCQLRGMPPYALLRCHVYDPGILPMPAQRNATLCTAQVPCLRSWDSTYASSEECHPMHCSGAMSTILGFYLCQLRGMPPYALLRCHVYDPGILPMPAQRNATLCTAQVPCLRSWDSTYASSEECHPMHCSGAMSKILGFYLCQLRGMPPYALLRCHVYDAGILPMPAQRNATLCTAQVPCLRSWDSTYASSEEYHPMHCSGTMSTILGFYLCQLRGMPPYALLRCHVYDPGILPMPAQRNATLCTAQVPCLRSWDSTYASSEECHPMHCSGAMSTILGFYLSQLRGFTERMESISVLYTSTTWTFLMNWKTVMKRPTSLQFLKRSD